ncbi:MAG TPA: sulfite exporter TauE/SafE family protein [Gaiellaceae bacterium]
MAVLAALLGFLGGALAGLFGVGGGVLFVPTLVLVLALSQVHAEATSLLAILPTVIAGAWRQQRYGNVRWRAAILVGLGSIVGVGGGVELAHSLSEHDLRRLFGAFVLLVAASIGWRALRRPAYPADDGRL